MRRNSKILIWLVLLVSLLSLPVFATEGESVASVGSLTHFVSGTPLTFGDIPAKAWYRKNVLEMSAMGLMSGVGGGKFDPEKSMEVAEAVSLAARIHAIYTTGDLTELNALPSKGGWFVRYYDYLEQRGLLETGWRQIPETPAPR
ncbi:MAG: S-layer homology domain-containing protein, partial [Clostridia bacterium]|nr:S-layer homology domain-containing protein [Clostridia bacterium]